jgi:hypothetical protein
MADEGAFLELLVANERVGRLLDVLADPTQRSRWTGPWLFRHHCHAHPDSMYACSQCRHKSTIMQLQAEVQRGSSYVEEVRTLHCSWTPNCARQLTGGSCTAGTQSRRHPDPHQPPSPHK